MTGDNKGFTIVEMLIVVLMFSIIMGTVTSVFASALKLQKYNLSNQQLLSQTSYAMEYMSRALRMARKDDGTCGFSGQNYRTSDGNRKIEFLNYRGDCQSFYLSGGQLMVDSDTMPLTSNDFIVNQLRFFVSGDIASDSEQPKVKINIEIEGDILGDTPKIKIQTSVSQRRLDI